MYLLEFPGEGVVSKVRDSHQKQLNPMFIATVVPMFVIRLDGIAFIFYYTEV